MALTACAQGHERALDASRGDTGRVGTDSGPGETDAAPGTDAGPGGDSGPGTDADTDAGTGVTCEDVTCDLHAVCDEGECRCNDGWEGSGTECSDIDECASEPTPCDPDICENTEGSYRCVTDMCPDDPDKTEPGACGCGNPDVDSDSDGALDCDDGCPSDPDKTAPGGCGCGTADTDSDSDGTLDCDDGCPSDPDKTSPGTCGCGSPEPSGSSTSTLGTPLTSSWTTSNYFRGNVYYAGSSTTLDSFDQYLGLSGACTVDFYVVRGSTADGPWTTVWSDRRTVSGTGYHASGAIDISIGAGSYYGLGVAWNCSATYYGNSSGWPGYDAGIGTFQKTFWDNSYPGYSTIYTPPETGSGSGLAYGQRVTTEGGCG